MKELKNVDIIMNLKFCDLIFCTLFIRNKTIFTMQRSTIIVMYSIHHQFHDPAPFFPSVTDRVGYLEFRLSRTIFLGPQEFEITGFYCTSQFWYKINKCESFSRFLKTPKSELRHSSFEPDMIFNNRMTLWLRLFSNFC